MGNSEPESSPITSQPENGAKSFFRMFTCIRHCTLQETEILYQSRLYNLYTEIRANSGPASPTQQSVHKLLILFTNLSTFTATTSCLYTGLLSVNTLLLLFRLYKTKQSVYRLNCCANIYFPHPTTPITLLPHRSN